MAGNRPGRRRKAAIDPPFGRLRHDHGRCVAAALAAAQSLCAGRGARLTPLRRHVLELIWQRHGPIGAYELLDRLRLRWPRAAPPTVYRTLDFLAGNGLIHRIDSLNAYIGCAAPNRSHRAYFLICRGCGQAAELADGALADALDHAARHADFTALGQTVEVSGYCAPCRALPISERS